MAIGTSNIIFRDGLFRLPVGMSGDNITSENISCNGLQDPLLPPGQQTRGSLTAGAIVFPDNWVASDIVFFGYLDDTFTDPFALQIGGAVNGNYIVSNCQPSTMVPLSISLFSNVKYFVVRSITLQPSSPILTVVFFPLEQLIA